MTEGQRRGGQGGSSAHSRSFAARSLLSSAKLLLAIQGFSTVFSFFFLGNKPGTNSDNFNCFPENSPTFTFLLFGISLRSNI